MIFEATELQRKSYQRRNLNCLRTISILCITILVCINLKNPLLAADLLAALDKGRSEIVYRNNITATDQTNQFHNNIKILQNSSDNKSSNVAIVTKVLWRKDVRLLRLWICFINHAFNDKKKYDFVIFTTLPFSRKDITMLQEVAKPANLTVSLEGPPLKEQLEQMTVEERKFLMKRCNKEGKEDINLTWNHHCNDPIKRPRRYNSLGYNWQAEFRAYHIWTHDALRNYKFMMWFDTDAKQSYSWDVDPIQIMIEKNLTIMYSCFGYGNTKKDAGLAKKLKSVYNVSICGISPQRNHSYIYAQTCQNETASFQQIGGYHHITNLDVFRSDIHQRFLKKFVGDYRFDRAADDQMAVTIVGTMEQYLRNKDLPSEEEYRISTYSEVPNGLDLKIGHHGRYNCRRPAHLPVNIVNYFKFVMGNWSGLEEKCWNYL